MTISIPTSTVLVSSSIVDTRATFNNAQYYASLPNGLEFQHEGYIYKNNGVKVTVPVYDQINEPYTIGTILWKDNLLKKVIEGKQPKQPADYTASVGGFDHTLWTGRYAKLQDMPAGHVHAVELKLTDSANNDIQLRPDGSHAYILNALGVVQEYSLSAPNAINTATKTTKTFTFASPKKRIRFKSDGLKMYAISDTQIKEFTTSTAWDIANLSQTASVNLPITDGTIDGFRFKSDGTKIYFARSSNNTVLEYNLSTAWNVATMSALVNTFTLPDIADETLQPILSNVDFSSDGLKMFLWDISSSARRIWVYALSTAWDISTATYSGIKSLLFESTNVGTFSGDGLKFYVVSLDMIYQFSNTSAWDCIYAVHKKAYHTVEEKRGNYTYKYRFEFDTDRGVYTTKSVVRALNRSVLTVEERDAKKYYVLTDDSIEVDADIITTDNYSTWIATTLIWTDTALWVRTHLDIAQEDSGVASTAFNAKTVESPIEISGFEDMGVTNQNKPFDGKNYTKATTKNGVLKYTVMSAEDFDTVALGKVKATSVNIDFKDANGNVVTNINTAIDTSIGNISLGHTTAIYYATSIIGGGGTVEITLYGDVGTDIDIGTIMTGISVNAGYSNLQFSNDIKDYSYAKSNDFGTFDYVERERVLTYKGSVDVPISNYDKTTRLMTYIGKRLVIVNGSTSKTIQPNGKSVFSSTQIIGRFMSFEHSTKIKDDDMDAMANYSFSLEEQV